ncbi:MAG: sigma factor-like helix-turn-helix DNA-binding protein [Patescibacteria group bacterium]
MLWNIEGQFISHRTVAKCLHIGVHKLEEAIKNGIVPFAQYNTEETQPTWWFTKEQAEFSEQILRAQRYSELPMPEETRVGVRYRVYNHSLRAARLRLGLTAAQLGKEVGVSAATIMNYENLRAFPASERAQAIANALGVAVHAIFAPWLSEFKLKSPPSILNDPHFSLQEALAAGIQLPSLPSPEEEVVKEIDRELLNEEIAQILESLPPRHQSVIRMRFGFDGGPPLTLEAISNMLGVTTERIRRIEGNALRALRRPMHTRKLRNFLD